MRYGDVHLEAAAAAAHHSEEKPFDWPTSHVFVCLCVCGCVCVVLARLQQACQTDGVLKLGQEENRSICCTLARVNIMARWPMELYLRTSALSQRDTLCKHTAAILLQRVVEQLQVRRLGLGYD